MSHDVVFTLFWHLVAGVETYLSLNRISRVIRDCGSWFEMILNV